MFEYLKALVMPSKSALAYSVLEPQLTEGQRSEVLRGGEEQKNSEVRYSGSGGNDSCQSGSNEIPYRTERGDARRCNISEAGEVAERDDLTSAVKQGHLRSSVCLNNNETKLENKLYRAASPSSTIAVIGAKGGVGATTLAINLAAAFAKQAGPATLVDANLQQPDAALMLGKKLSYSLADLINKSPDLTDEVIDACRVSLSDEVSSSYLLSPPINGEAVLRIQLSQVSECLEAIRESCRYWVVDLPRQLDRHLVIALDRADLIVLVFEPTSTALSAAKRWINVFDDLGYNRDKVYCVLNRAGSESKNIEVEAKTILPDYPVFKIPNAFLLAEKTFLSGQPAVVRKPRAPYSKAVINLVVQLARVLENGIKNE